MRASPRATDREASVVCVCIRLLDSCDRKSGRKARQTRRCGGKERGADQRAFSCAICWSAAHARDQRDQYRPNHGSQAKLQALIDQNATHYIALSNASFQSQEQIKSVMKTTANQIQSLSKNQAQLANTCDGMMRGIDNLATSITQMNISSSMSDTSSAISSPAHLGGIMGNRINPPPRKLNRRIKGVWYEYDMSSTTPTASPRKQVGFTDTTTKSPATPKKT
jgi:hypothetical protein